MKRSHVTLIAACLMFTMLCSCQAQALSPGHSSSSGVTSHDYSEIDGLQIEFDGVFVQPDSEYFVYFYLEYCGHCLRLKNEVISFAMDGYFPIFFVLYGDSIPIGMDIGSTIGLTSIDGLFIMGVPTLIQIEGGTITEHVCGEAGVSLLLEKCRSGC